MSRLYAPPPPTAFELAHPNCVVHVPEQPRGTRIDELKLIVAREYGELPRNTKKLSLHIVFKNEESARNACSRELDVTQGKRRTSLRVPIRMKASPGRQVLDEEACSTPTRPQVRHIQEIPAFASVHLLNSPLKPPSYFLDLSSSDRAVHIVNLPMRASTCLLSKIAWQYGRNNSCVYRPSGSSGFQAIILFEDPASASAAVGKALEIPVTHVSLQDLANMDSFIMNQGSGYITTENLDIGIPHQITSAYFPDPAIMEDIASLLYGEVRPPVATHINEENRYPENLQIPSFGSLRLSSLDSITSSPSADAIPETSLGPVLPSARHRTLSIVLPSAGQKRPRRSSLDEITFWEEKKVRLDETFIAAKDPQPSLSASLQLLDQLVPKHITDLTNTANGLGETILHSPSRSKPETQRSLDLGPQPLTPNSTNGYFYSSPNGLSDSGLSPSDSLSESSSLFPLSAYLELLRNPGSSPSSLEPDDDNYDDSRDKGDSDEDPDHQDDDDGKDSDNSDGEDSGKFKDNDDDPENEDIDGDRSDSASVGEDDDDGEKDGM